MKFEIVCGYCERGIVDGEEMYLAKEPHREPRPAHARCGEKAKEDRPRVSLIKKINRRGLVADAPMAVL